MRFSEPGHRAVVRRRRRFSARTSRRLRNHDHEGDDSAHGDAADAANTSTTVSDSRGGHGARSEDAPGRHRLRSDRPARPVRLAGSSLRLALAWSGT